MVHDAISVVHCAGHTINLVVHDAISVVHCAGHIITLVVHDAISVVHCAGHIIDLVVHDAISVVPMFRDSLRIFGNLVNFIRHSPKRLHIFEHFQDAR